MSDTTILVASHNVMQGDMGYTLQFNNHYERLRKQLKRPIDILCIQENALYQNTNTWVADRFAKNLEMYDQNGHRYGAFFDRGVTEYRDGTLIEHAPLFPNPVIIWNRERLYATQWFMPTIPRLEEYGLLGKIFGSDEAQQRTVSAMQFNLRGSDSAPFSTVSFHLDTWGGNAHKARQLRTAVDVMRERFGASRLIACGDTNIYASFMLPSKRLQRRKIQKLLSGVGLTDTSSEQTHYFSRMPGNSWAIRMIRLGAKLKLLAPSKLDTVASNLPVIERGVVRTPESDHDMVWAIVDVG